MGEQTNISWCDHTFNPVIGCCKISAGCANCYALTLMETRYKRAQWGPNTRRVRTGSSNWKKPLQWNASAKATGKRAKVFCASLSDVFEDHPDWVEPRRDLLNMIINTPHLDWLLLTKRPENVNQMIEQATGFSESAMWFHAAQNVWIGTSVEDQDAADKRIPELLKVPAKLHFLSCEPLLGPVDLSPWMSYFGQREKAEWLLHRWGSSNPIDWVIVGGESGQKARPMQIEWARSLRDQCQAAGVSFFMKQLGGVADKRHDLKDMPEDLRIREFPESVTA